MKSTKKVVYIAGPITGVERYWAPFLRAEEQLIAAGFIPLNPAHLPEGMSKAQYMQIDLAMLMVADAVLMLPGYNEQSGADIERRLGCYVGKPVEGAVSALKEVFANE